MSVNGSISFPAASEIDSEIKVLCDTVGKFLRRYDTTNGVVTTVNTTLDGVTAYVPVGAVTECSAMELDNLYSAASLVCVDNVGVKTQQFIRQRQIADNLTGLITSTTTEYSTDGSAWSVTVPTGTITAGVCPIVITTSNLLPVRTTSSIVGTTTAGRQGVSVTNVGIANGTFLGQVLVPGETISAEAYLNPVTNVYQRLSAMAWDGTGTVLHIIELP